MDTYFVDRNRKEQSTNRINSEISPVRHSIGRDGFERQLYGLLIRVDTRRGRRGDGRWG